jgi:hypothetical protein
MEIFNDLCIISVSYHLFLWTGYMPDLEIQYNIGYSVICITVLNIGINLLIVMKEGFNSMKTNFIKLRKWFKKLKLRKNNKIVSLNDIECKEEN